MTKKNIIEFLASHKKELKNRFGLVRIGLFGSYSVGCEDENSDIDLVIELEKKDFFIRDGLREYLETIFKVPVDIGYLDSFRKFYKTKIDKDIIYV